MPVGRNAIAAGFGLNSAGKGLDFEGLTEKLGLPQGYSLAGSDGGVFNFGDARFNGSMSGTHLSAAVVGVSTPDGDGYWLTGSDGGVFSFGESFEGSEAGKHLSAPIVGMATPGFGGYWLVGVRRRGVQLR